MGLLGLPGRRKDAFLFLVHSNLRGREDPGSLRALALLRLYFAF